MIYSSQSLQETREIARIFLKKLKPLKNEALVIAMDGDLGSGKTSFVKELANILDIKNNITSPTFVLEKIYKLPPKSLFKKLIHIDAYRLNKDREILSLDWYEILQDSRNLIFIEWPDRVKDFLPKNTITIKFKFINEKTREIKI